MVRWSWIFPCTQVSTVVRESLVPWLMCLAVAACQGCAALPTHEDLMVVLEDQVTGKQLEHCRPDIGAMPGLDFSGRVKGVILTVKGDSKYDFYSRHFDPWQGVPEDPVTGSTLIVLAPCWGERLGKETMVARQSPERGDGTGDEES